MLAFSAAVATDDTFVYETVGGWTVRTDRARNYDCFAEAVYEDGTLFRIGVDSMGTGSSILVADPTWESIDPGSKHSFVISFDTMGSWNFVATGLTINAADGLTGAYVEIPPADRTAIVEQFMLAAGVEFSLGTREPVSLSLSGSYRATEIAAECQSAMARLRSPYGSGDPLNADESVSD